MWSCAVVSIDAHTKAVYGLILTVVMHLEVYSRLRVDSSCRDVASLSPLMVCVGVWLWLCYDASGMNNAHIVRRMTSNMIRTKIKTPIQQLDQVSRVTLLAVDHRRLLELRAYPRFA